MSNLIEVSPLGFSNNAVAAAELVRRTFDEGRPDQYKRELVQNSIDAGAKNIYTTVARLADRGSKVSGIKRAFVDDGRGMAPSKLPVYIGELFAGESTIDGTGTNFQMGARVSTLPFNHGGFIVASWTEGDPLGAMIEIVYDEGKRAYGMNQYIEVGTEDAPEFSEVMTPPAWMKPDIIEKSGHGTVVILMGDKYEDHTIGEIERNIVTGRFIYPQEVRGRADWHYYNSKFWTLPDGVGLRTLWINGTIDDYYSVISPESIVMSRVKGTPTLMFRMVKGVESTLYEYAESLDSMRVQTSVGNATVRWALFPKDRPSTPGHQGGSGFDVDLEIPLGLFGEKRGDEIYNVHSRRQTAANMEWYGIGMRDVRDRLVLIVEPDPESPKFMGARPSSSRSHLMLGGKQLPHDVWGEFFANNLPKEIRERMDELRSTDVVDTDWQKKFTKRLREFMGAAFKPTPKGVVEVTEVEVSDGVPRSTTGGGSGGRGSGIGRPETGRGVGGAAVAEEGGAATGAKTDQRAPSPIKPVWRSDEFEADEKRGMLAHYVPAGRELYLNPDNKLLRSIIDQAKSERRKSKADQVEELSREAVANYLIGHILSSEVLHRRVPAIGELSGNKLLNAVISDQVLTAMCANLSMMEAIINAQFKGRRGLGRIGEDQEEAGVAA